MPDLNFILFINCNNNELSFSAVKNIAYSPLLTFVVSAVLHIINYKHKYIHICGLLLIN